MTNATDTSTQTVTPIRAPIDRPTWLTEEIWPHPVHGLGIQGETLAYTDVGAGPTLLLSHVGMWSFVWRDLIEELRHDFRCVAFDAPGTGLSSGSSKVRIEAAADAITALVTSLDLTDMVVVFHDLGGPCTLQAAAAWPERVRGLTAVNTFGWRPAGAAFRGMLAVMGSAPMRGLDVWTGWLPRMTSTRFGVGRHLDRSERKAFQRGMNHRGRRSFHRYMRGVRKHDFETVDATVQRLSDLPMLTVFGENNDPLDFQPQWAERFADIEHIVVPEGNHFPMCDDPVLLAEAIRDWHRRCVG